MIPYTLYSLFLKFLWKFLITFILTLKGGNIQSVYKSRIPAQQLSRGKTNNKVVSGEITIEIAERKNEILSRIENCIVDKSTRYIFQMIILYKMQSNWWKKKSIKQQLDSPLLNEENGFMSARTLFISAVFYTVVFLY